MFVASHDILHGLDTARSLVELATTQDRAFYDAIAVTLGKKVYLSSKAIKNAMRALPLLSLRLCHLRSSPSRSVSEVHFH